SLPGTEAAHKLVVTIRQKCSPEEALAVLKDLPNPRSEEDADGRFNPLKIDVFVQTLLNLGSKSFSHSFAAISKFHYVFKILAESEEAQICILRNMFELWHNHQQMMIVLVDKMLKTQIVECSAVANWIFSKEMNSEFTKMYLWEILHLTIKKMNKHVIKIGGELVEAREKLARAESSDSESDDDEKKKQASLPGTEAAHKLVVTIRQKCSPEEALAVLKDLPNPRSEEDADGRFNPLKIDVFVQTLLNLGSKSFSHSFAAISKFHYVFKILAESEEAQICILRNMFELWHNHQQMMIVLVDKMLKTQIVECSAVANWIFSKEMNSEFTKMYLWEILHLTIKKMNKHVIKIGGELVEAREKLARAESSDSESDDDEKKKQDDLEKPTEEMIEKMEEKLEGAQGDQKNLFLIIFQRFIMILTEHLVRCDTDGKDYGTHWYKWTIGRLQQIFLAHHEQVQKYSSTLETLLFTQDLDNHILEVFQQFVSLRA
uniref:Nuclear cap-binding protein subunit 1-like n=1 Tax=Diabrotica virgifera virgifera TaxID=50390 RepID=A0A6P7GAR9_DIAVI